MKDRETLDRIHRLMFGIEWHDERFRKIAEELSAAGYSFDADHLTVGDRPGTRDSLDLIHGLLDSQEWTGATLAAISVILSAAGYTVKEPLLAFDFGESPEPPTSE